MKQLKSTIVLVLSAAVGLALFPAYVHADHLGQVSGVTCSQPGDGVLVEWGPLENPDAVKYSVDFTCTKDLGDELISLVDFSIGTSERTDGGEMDDPNLYASFAELNAAAEAYTQTINDLTGYTCYVKVKGLDPGKGKGRQNHEFSFSDPAVSCGEL